MIIENVANGGLIENYFDLSRIIGSITVPLTTFLLVEGYLHTKNIRKYFLRLLLAMLVSEIPYRLVIFGDISSGGIYFGNIMAVFILALIALYLFDKVKENLLLTALSFISMCIIAMTLRVDGGAYGICLVFIYFFFRDNLLAKNILFLVAYVHIRFNFLTGLIIIILLSMYNGNLSNRESVSAKEKQTLKYVYYLIYPLHYIIIYIFKLLMTI